MRFLRVLKTALPLAGALICAVFVFALTHSPVFAGGRDYELYFGDSASRMVLSEDPVLDKLLSGGVRGESARYDGDVAAQLCEKFRARLLFTEEVCGVRNYYLYSPLLKGGVRLKEGKVNLHIAVSEGQTAVGTPLIFGGF